ncbi:hypothetical protein SAMN03159343_3089 [Klenkia marina]|uniref:Uncharacterized protein n=2 Tax=Klenkia marina TaxID=1960309 RepID=A0A1G4YM09_9ACTN|nr:hypothetical protein SAMN03159343_3089 [Klenkia marina]
MAVASLTPAAVCTGCYLTHRRRTEALTGAAMALMLLAMVDTMLLGGRLLAPPAWGALLVAGAVVVQVDRWRRGSGADPVLHLAAMGALLLLPALGGSAGHHHVAGDGMTGAMASGPAGWVLLAVLAVVVAHTGHAWLRVLRTRDTTTRVEVGTAAASVVAMAAMALA